MRYAAQHGVELGDVVTATADAPDVEVAHYLPLPELDEDASSEALVAWAHDAMSLIEGRGW